MVLMCFVLDLRSLSLPLITDLKQSLLQLVNLYAVSLPSWPPSESVKDQIGLCYILKDRISFSDELKIAYSPSGNFSLRDFHGAVNGLPTNAFSPEMDDSGAVCFRDLKLPAILSDQVLYAWGGKDITRKVIVLSSCLPENFKSETKNVLMEAADKCVSVEFLLMEQASNHCVPENINSFRRCISDLENCSFQSCLPDANSLHRLVKHWLLDLIGDIGEPLQARFFFKSNLVGTANKLFCNLNAAANHIVDGFSPCQACRCHGLPLSDEVKERKADLICPVTSSDLGETDVIGNSVKVGDNTVLFMPSPQSYMKPQAVSPPMDFNVIERTNLNSLSEGVIMGRSFFVTPAATHEMEVSSQEADQSELNALLFQGLCSTLFSMDQGLVCSSNCNIETMRIATFHCFYILQPSKNGPMLLRRLAGSEEVLPISDVSMFTESIIPREMETSIRSSLLKIESTNYNPLKHERGFHEKLNLLVKESLHFGSLPSNPSDKSAEQLSSKKSDSLEVTLLQNLETNSPIEGKIPPSDKTGEDDQTTACITEEWEQLVVIPRKHSPNSSVSKPNSNPQVLSPADCSKPIDIKTSRILERLEAPRKMKPKVTSPLTITSRRSSQVCLPIKEPLIPFPAVPSTQESISSSQLLKPNFQRLKRKHR